MSLLNKFKSLFTNHLRRRALYRPLLQVEAPELLESRLMLSTAGGDLGGLSDEFEQAAEISNWQRINEVEGWNADQLETWDINQTNAGRMTMRPHTVVWYEDYRGPLAFKNVTGDFVFTSEVHITDRDDVGGSDADDVPGDAQFSLGGLMIRTPRDINNPATDWSVGSQVEDGTNNGENYVFLSMGHGTDGQFTFEVKTTRNSDSNLVLTPVNSNTAMLQLARIGDAVIALYKLPGEDWTVHRRYRRADMPETLQVGLVSYTDWLKASDYTPFEHNSTVLQPGIADPTPAEPFNPDIEASFEFARFARPDLPAALQGVDLVDDASNAQLLSFLGELPTKTTVTVAGTSGNDKVEVSFNAANDYIVTVNGMKRVFDAESTACVNVNGGGGRDLIEINGTAASDTAFLRFGKTTLSGDTYQLTAVNFENTRVNGQGGDDLARLYDTAGDQTLVSKPAFSKLTGGNFYHYVQGFEDVYSYASNGNDSATLFDSGGADTFVGRPTFSSMSGASFYRFAKGFDRVNAIASNGNDLATLYDSNGNDIFVGKPAFSYLKGDDFFNHAQGFDRVNGYASSGDDKAILYDSAGKDTFYGRGQIGRLTGDDFFNFAKGFDEINANAANGGIDTLDLGAIDYLFKKLGSWEVEL